jgi:hypothetical protein
VQNFLLYFSHHVFSAVCPYAMHRYGVFAGIPPLGVIDDMVMQGMVRVCHGA